VEEADCGEAALALLEHDRPDMVFLDLLMPGMPGLEVLRRIRAARIDVPVVIVTAEGQAHHRAACEDLGVHAYLNKPVNPQQISRVLESAEAVLL